MVNNRAGVPTREALTSRGRPDFIFMKSYKMSRKKICKDCRNSSDQIRVKLMAGDKSKIYPPIIPAVPMKCDRCNKSLTSNMEIFLIYND